VSTPPTRWRTLAAAALGIVALIVVVVISLRWVAWSGENSEAPPLDLISVALSAVSVLIAVAGLWVAWRTLSSSERSNVTDVKAAAQTLAQHVERQWADEIRIRKLNNPHPMPTSWRFDTNAKVMSPRHLIAEESFIFDGRSDDIAALANQFLALKRRRLVITGGPGTGKTTLAVQMLLHLLATRSTDPAVGGVVDPVPVLLPIGGWNITAYPRFQDWLADHLERDYPALRAPQLGPDVAATLVRGGHVLPILDGLEEVDKAHRVGLIVALNDFLTDQSHLILTSRRTEFRTTVDEAGPLTTAAVIVPIALSRQDAAKYLRSCLPSSPSAAWENVLSALAANGVPGLAKLAVIPLWLWLIRTVYVHGKGDLARLTDTLGDNADALSAHLLKEAIPALITAREHSNSRRHHYHPQRSWKREQVTRYLTYLAQTFPPSKTREFAWWHIAGTIPRIQRLFEAGEKLVVPLAFALPLATPKRSPIDYAPGYCNLRLHGRITPLFRSVGLYVFPGS
jgi:hypothetical protein